MTATRLATPDDAEVVARMLHDFNVEFDTPTPGVEFLSGRFRTLLASGDVTVIGAPQDAVDQDDAPADATPADHSPVEL